MFNPIFKENVQMGNIQWVAQSLFLRVIEVNDIILSYDIGDNVLIYTAIIWLSQTYDITM